ncbi:MAG TPA: hypothetical protein VKC62_04800 [Gaiellaceae bacterium]|nr:hypothetical protein [Gaiellaceae bacterium]
MTDVIARLAAANPVPTGAAVHEPARLPARRIAVAAVLVAAVAVPAVAFAGRLADALGISNGGTTVSTSEVLPGQSGLDQAMQELKVGGTMQYLGTLNGTSFYATRNADGHFCLAIDHTAMQYDKGFGCDLNADGFPSSTVQALVFPPVAHFLQGVAADGVATVELLDADGNVVESTPVTDNLFESDAAPTGTPASIVTLDATGTVTSRRPLPQPSGS